MEGYLKHPEIKELLSALSLQPTIGHFSLKNGVIRFKNRIWVPHNSEAQQSIIQALHSSPIGGHSGIYPTYTKIKSLFAWPGMKAMVQTAVSHCQICQQAKTERVKYPGLLQPLPVPDQA